MRLCHPVTLSSSTSPVPTLLFTSIGVNYIQDGSTGQPLTIDNRPLTRLRATLETESPEVENLPPTLGTADDEMQELAALPGDSHLVHQSGPPPDNSIPRPLPIDHCPAFVLPYKQSRLK